MATIEFDTKTHNGKVYDHNEDSICAIEDLSLWVIADGMGGHACGEVASDIVVRELERLVSGGESLVPAIEMAHQAVVKEAEINTQAKNMGSTVVAMSIAESDYTIAWVGDSRGYRLRNNTLELLTRDHSYLEWLKDNGVSVEESRNHPQRNVITQSIGIGDPNPDTVSDRFKAGDRYLLCSDGLNDELTDEEIAKILSSPDDSGLVTDSLIELALLKGGRDNISVIVVDIDPKSRTNKFLGLGEIPVVKNLLPVIFGIVTVVIITILVKILR